MNIRPVEITNEFIKVLEQHLEQLVSGQADEYLEIREIADMLHIHPTHLSNTIKEVTGKSPCEICHEKTIEKAKELLADDSRNISYVARQLTYDPSNFTKYFKNRTGVTPSEYKKSIKEFKF